MNSTVRSIAVCALASLCLAACGSTPPSRYFSLSPTVAVAEPEPGSTVALGLGPIRMPDYLERTQLVTRGAGQELSVHQYSRWAEPLSKSFHRILAVDVDNSVDGLIVVGFPWDFDAVAELDYRLLGDVTQFEADQSGRVILDVQWGVVELDTNERVVLPRRTRYETRAASAGDPASITSAMNEALGELGRDIASEMRAVLDR